MILFIVGLILFVAGNAWCAALDERAYFCERHFYAIGITSAGVLMMVIGCVTMLWGLLL